MTWFFIVFGFCCHFLFHLLIKSSGQSEIANNRTSYTKRLTVMCAYVLYTIYFVTGNLSVNIMQHTTVNSGTEQYQQ